ncbi:MAG: hypothetical protein AM326_05660 [Candidatus Thorarchaeota archaeon SMTZ-45]|nr:MAG: hypothetical protein AM325_07510 [Candidatus Thorarchaeota archaeon SMTZ1-45]KXH77154.1 MAG: hypothetical protein AM326_05660 [Candidatus Thorarchaeota archaeon SMTZ-45]
MYVQEHLTGDMIGFEEHPDPAWIAGAKSGMTEALYRARSSGWREFFDSLETLFRHMIEVPPAEPGTSTQNGSLYETLGGYVSVVGTMTSEGLTFSVPPIRQQVVASLFAGMQLYRNGKELLVPHSELDIFSRLVPLRGPIELEVFNR